MSPAQTEQIEALAHCTFSPGSWAKRFVRKMKERGANYALSDRQVESLEGLAHSYRLQLGKCMATACVKCGTPDENDDIPPATAERHRAAKFSRNWCKRFMALRNLGNHEDENGHVWNVDADDQERVSVFGPVGGSAPATFKTYRNAKSAAGEDGFVVMFDVRSLPLVGEEAVHGKVDGGNEIDFESFAERQMLFWAGELARARAIKPEINARREAAR